MLEHKTIAGEFIGTFILVLFGCGSVAGAVLFGAFTSLFQVAALWGIAVAIGIYASRSLSQSHLNPAVTWAMWLNKGISSQQVLSYLVGQFTGAFAAGYTLYALMASSIRSFETANDIVRGTEGSHISAQMFGEFYPNPGFIDAIEVSTLQASLIEALGTFVLVLVIFRVTAKGQKTDNTTPWTIGLTVAVIISLIAPFTQAGLNPARDLAPRLVTYFQGWGSAVMPADGGAIWVYVLGPIVGASVAFGVNRIIEQK